MISGKVALGGLSLEFGNAEERFAALSADLETLTKREGRLLENEGRILADLARLYLPELSRDAVTNGIAELSSAMETALAAQGEHRRDLEARLGALPDTLLRLELVLAEAERAEEVAAEGVRTVKEQVEAELGSADDGAHSLTVVEHRTLMERRSVVAARRLRLQTTAGVERRRYEGDPAFRHLHSRRFGEPDYTGGPIARWLDSWLARRIEYDRLRRNYLILTRGPSLMTLELRELTEEGTRLEAAIDAQETGVGDRLGLPSALAALARAQDELLQARSALREGRERHDRLAAEVRAVDANRGRPWEDAVARHQDFLATRSLKELVELARSTPDPKDDGLVSRLEQVRVELTEVGRSLRKVREELERMNDRVTGLGDLMRRASERFTSRRSWFPESAKLASLVSAVAEGTADVDSVFAELSTEHRRTPLLTPGEPGDFDGWFADLSARFDRELGAVEVRHEGHDDVESSVVVYDNHGRVLHRRISRRSKVEG